MITPEELKQSEKNLQDLRRRLENATDDERAILAEAVLKANEAHQAMFQQYTREMQRQAEERSLKRFFK